MRRLFIYFSAVLILSTVTSANLKPDSADNTQKQYYVAGVAFYNLENLFDTINQNGTYDLEFTPEGARMWTSERYHKKINNMASAIIATSTPETPYGPAVMGISEVENSNVVSDLVRRIDELLAAEGKTPWGLKFVHHDSPDRRGIDVALLYNPAYFELKDVNAHRLIIDGEPDFKTRDQLVVTGRLLESPMSFIVNHYPSRLGGQEQSSYLREAAAGLSLAIADSLWRIDPDMGIVMMGDLNDDPQDKSISKVFGAMREYDDAKSKPHGFYNPFWWILDNGVGTLCYRGEWNLFDQIIPSGNLLDENRDGIYYWKATVHNLPMLRTPSGKYRNYPLRTYASGEFLNGYSDHFPTEIFFVKEIKQ